MVRYFLRMWGTHFLALALTPSYYLTFVWIAQP